MAERQSQPGSENPWALVIPASPLDHADEKWAAWIEQFGLPEGDDIRVDIVHTSSGDHRRYLVRRGPLTAPGYPLAWKAAGQSSSEIAASALAIGWPPISILKFLKTEMGIPLSDAKALVDEILPSDVQLADAKLRAVAELSLHIRTTATDSDIERLEAQTGITTKLRALVAAGRHDEVRAVVERWDTEAHRFNELPYVDALALAQRFLGGSESEIRLEVLDGIEYDFGWIFPYRPIKSSAAGPRRFIGGNAPILIDRYTARLWVTGTAYSQDIFAANYRSTGDPSKSKTSEDA